MSDYFPGMEPEPQPLPPAAIPRAPTKPWLTDWNARLEERRLPPLSQRECKQLADTSRRLWEQRGRDGDLILALIGQWFDRGGRWANLVGYSVEGFTKWIRSGLLEVDAERSRQASEAAKRSREAQRHKALTEAPAGLPSPEEGAARARAAKLAMLRGGMAE